MGNSAMDRHNARAAEFARAEKARAADSVKAERAREAAMKAANIDTAGLDPEMRATLGGEAARRVGAAGVGVKTRNPLAWLFRRKPKPPAVKKP